MYIVSVYEFLGMVYGLLRKLIYLLRIETKPNQKTYSDKNNY